MFHLVVGYLQELRKDQISEDCIQGKFSSENLRTGTLKISALCCLDDRDPGAFCNAVDSSCIPYEVSDLEEDFADGKEDILLCGEVENICAVGDVEACAPILQLEAVTLENQDALSNGDRWEVLIWEVNAGDNP